MRGTLDLTSWEMETFQGGREDSAGKEDTEGWVDTSGKVRTGDSPGDGLVGCV